AEDRGEVVSTPRVITTDGQEAVIEQGREVPYVTLQGNDDPATTEFKEVVMNLTVTPQITPNEQIILNLEVTKDNILGFEEGKPYIATRSLSTQVLVDDGNTVVLGGVYLRTNNKSKTQIPLLGDIPFIGALFTSTAKQRKKEELLVFITPKILRETLTNY